MSDESTARLPAVRTVWCHSLVPSQPFHWVPQAEVQNWLHKLFQYSASFRRSRIRHVIIIIVLFVSNIGFTHSSSITMTGFCNCVKTAHYLLHDLQDQTQPGHSRGVRTCSYCSPFHQIISSSSVWLKSARCENFKNVNYNNWSPYYHVRLFWKFHLKITSDYHLLRIEQWKGLKLAC